MKGRILLLSAVAVVLVLGVAGCGNKTTSQPGNTNTTTQSNTTGTNENKNQAATTNSQATGTPEEQITAQGEAVMELYSVGNSVSAGGASVK